MPVVWQHHPCVDPERTFCLGRPHRLAQQIHLLDQRPRPSVGQIHREEDASAAEFGAQVAGQARTLPRTRLTPRYPRTMPCKSWPLTIPAASRPLGRDVTPAGKL
jgi:hypothetical protein